VSRRKELWTYWKNCAAADGERRVEDFDWSVKVLVAADQLAKINEPRVQLTLKVEENAGLHEKESGKTNNTSANEEEGKKYLNFEMDSQQLDRLLEKFAQINGVLQQIKTN